MASLVASVAPSLAAVRIAPTRTVSGVLWGHNRLLTSDQALPAMASYSVALSTGTLVPARPGPRDSGSNLALLQLDSPVFAPLPAPATTAAVGTLVIVVGAAFDGSPTARLGMVHRLSRSAGREDAVATLDIAGRESEHGGLVLDALGGMLGMPLVGETGEISVIPHSVLTRFAGAPADRLAAAPVQQPSAPAARPSGPRRGWLGVALQPITVPEPMVSRAGQNSGRMVVNLTPGGPAEQAGLAVGDVLLALNGQPASGSHALRAFLAEEKIGTQVEIRLLRDGTVRTAHLTVAAQPG